MSASSGVLVILAVHVVIARLLAVANGPAPKVGSRYLVSYGRLPKGIAVLSLILPSLLGIIAVRSSGYERMALATLTVAFAALSAYLLVECFCVRIEFDEAHIYTASRWRGSRVIPWSSVVSCTYSSLKRWWVLSTTEYGNVRIHDFMRGRETLLAKLDAQRVAVMRER